ncbi:hypothetical protein CDL15_Pgr028001 [Punica granatum]|uniref:Uncharacterized protein n=1 Tax=Punica granatum TaxID=22663 RepID=A0A218XK16_PUNGR|nr:hypothetical protein CDL15_Pgr028001 [Punica granatum]
MDFANMLKNHSACKPAIKQALLRGISVVMKFCQLCMPCFLLDSSSHVGPVKRILLNGHCVRNNLDSSALKCQKKLSVLGMKVALGS